MNRKKALISTANYRKTKKGLVTNLYHKMKSRHEVDFQISKLHEFSECQKFSRLYEEWVKSGYKKKFKPSIDRINNKKHYSLGNIQWLTWAENRYKQIMERRDRSPKVAQMLNGICINTYKSQREAVKQTGVSQANLSSALNGRRHTCGGFEWIYIYENPELLQP